jgi:hypothetical protein
MSMIACTPSDDSRSSASASSITVPRIETERSEPVDERLDRLALGQPDEHLRRARRQGQDARREDHVVELEGNDRFDLERDGLLHLPRIRERELDDAHARGLRGERRWSRRRRCRSRSFSAPSASSFLSEVRRCSASCATARTK